MGLVEVRQGRRRVYDEFVMGECPMITQEGDGFLKGFRVLDLADEKGIFCGKILADFGADVIQIEKPGGSTSRNIGPFYHDIPDPEKSLFWYAYAMNKKGITLNIETADGREIFKRLVKTAHFAIESFPPGYMENLGLSYSELSEINPGLIMTSITPFGDKDPYREFKGPDIVVTAMGGFMYLTGDTDRAPLRISWPQAYFLTATRAAAGTMVAHYHRETTGEGQQITANALTTVSSIGMNAIPFWVLGKTVLKRAGPFRVGLSTSAVQRQTWECKDGFVTFSVYGGHLAARNIPSLLKWIESEGFVDNDLNELKKKDWATFDMAGADQELFDLMSRCFGGFFLRHTKRDLYTGAIERGLMLYPIYSAKEILEDPQLEARQYWVEVEHPELGATLTYPGAFIKLSQTPCKARCRAPFIGEHNLEIFERELGISREKLVVLKQAGVI